jgi:hypothetical protein
LFHWDSLRLRPFDLPMRRGKNTTTSTDPGPVACGSVLNPHLGFVGVEGTFHLLGAPGIRSARRRRGPRYSTTVTGACGLAAVWAVSGRTVPDHRPAARAAHGSVWSVTMDSGHRLWLSVDGGLICLTGRSSTMPSQHAGPA